jgi:hypothetical protein
MSPPDEKMYNIRQDQVSFYMCLCGGGKLSDMLGIALGKGSEIGATSALNTLTLGKLAFSDGFLRRMTEGNDPLSKVKFCIQASLGSLL